jgi:hypothetical protein
MNNNIIIDLVWYKLDFKTRNKCALISKDCYYYYCNYYDNYYYEQNYALQIIKHKKINCVNLHNIDLINNFECLKKVKYYIGKNFDNSINDIFNKPNLIDVSLISNSMNIILNQTNISFNPKLKNLELVNVIPSDLSILPSNLKSFKFNHQILKSLEHLTKLNHLSVRYIDIKHIPLNIKSLCFRINNDNNDNIDMIKFTKLTDLQISFDNFKKYEINLPITISNLSCNRILNFSSLQNLKSLEIFGYINETNKFYLPKSLVKLNLKTRNYLNIDNLNSLNLKTFIGSLNNKQSIYDLLKNPLISLELSIENSIDLNDIFPTTLRNLKLDYSNYSIYNTEDHPKIKLRNLPNIETLNIQNLNIDEINYPQSLKFIEINCLTYPEFTNILPKVKEITLHNYNYPLKNVFINATTIKISSWNKNIISGMLPNNLEYLNFGLAFNKIIRKNVLPKTLKSLIFGGNFNRKLTYLPDSLIELDFGSSYSHNCGDILKSLTKLKKLKMHEYSKTNYFPPSLENLTYLGSELSCEILLPLSKLVKLYLGNLIKITNLPNNIVELRYFGNSLDCEILNKLTKLKNICVYQKSCQLKLNSLGFVESNTAFFEKIYF